MKFLIIILTMLSVHFSALGQSDWTHPKVKQRNLINNYITKEGKIIYGPTNNDTLQRANYYEYFNNLLFATTDYVLIENGRRVFITYRVDVKTGVTTQTVETESNPSPLVASITIAQDQKKQLTTNGVVSTIYRHSNFIDLLSLKTVRGKLLMQN